MTRTDGQRGAKGREAIDVWRGSLDGGARAESRVVVLIRKHHPANSRKSAVFEARGCAELQIDSDRPPALRTRVRYENQNISAPGAATPPVGLTGMMVTARVADLGSGA